MYDYPENTPSIPEVITELDNIASSVVAFKTKFLKSDSKALHHPPTLKDKNDAKDLERPTRSSLSHRHQVVISISENKEIGAETRKTCKMELMVVLLEVTVSLSINE